MHSPTEDQKTLTLSIQQQNQILELITCPISRQIMKNPVKLLLKNGREGGATIEKAMYDRLVEQHNPLCPITRIAIKGSTKDFKTMHFINWYLSILPSKRAELFDDREVGPQSITIITIPNRNSLMNRPVVINVNINQPYFESNRFFTRAKIGLLGSLSCGMFSIIGTIFSATSIQDSFKIVAVNMFSSLLVFSLFGVYITNFLDQSQRRLELNGVHGDINFGHQRAQATYIGALLGLSFVLSLSVSSLIFLTLVGRPENCATPLILGAIASISAMTLIIICVEFTKAVLSCYENALRRREYIEIPDILSPV